jgi:chloride channel protein, CIC family
MEKPRPSVLGPPRWRKYTAAFRKDLAATYSRDLHKWLLIAPVIGVVTGLLITGVVVIILDLLWPPILNYYLRHHWAIIPGLLAAFVITGLIMQYLTPDPNKHSTEEIIRSYHEHQGDINMRPFLAKLLAAVTTVGGGGSAALEGPSIYGGGALGSWLWTRFRRFGAEPRDRRIMLISGAAAGMAAVFRAPLTGLVFALEMPYKDDLAHEALLPSLIASVFSYATLIAFLGSATLFDFKGGARFSSRDLLFSVLLGSVCGVITMGFDLAYRHFRTFMVKTAIPHWLKLAGGGLLTGICGFLFVSIFAGKLIPIGPNYEAVDLILTRHYGSHELVTFAGLKLAATLFTLGSGGVSAMFVPLFLTGGCVGTAFGQTLVHSPSLDLYAAVGMAAFIAGGYKTPLTAVVFVAEATGGHAYIIPALIGAAVAYAISGEASVSGDQRLHESVKVQELRGIPVSEIMQKQVISVDVAASLQDFADVVTASQRHPSYPVCERGTLLGTISMSALTQVARKDWPATPVVNWIKKDAARIAPDCDVLEALRLLLGPREQHLLTVVSARKEVLGVVTKTDILRALEIKRAGSWARLSAEGVENSVTQTPEMPTNHL